LRYPRIQRTGRTFVQQLQELTIIVYSCKEVLPPSETPVLVLYRGNWRVGELCEERPTWEESFKPFRYWDDPYNDGQEWDWHDVTHWAHLPEVRVQSVNRSYIVEQSDVEKQDELFLNLMNRSGNKK
jgi:hypothetical protein